MITNAMHARQPEPNDEVDASVRRNRHVFGEPIRARNYNDHLRQRMWWLHFVENRWVTFTYIFFACALIRMWVLVSATENRVYIAITAGATAAVVIFYLRWRRRREVVVREAFAQRQQEIDGSFVSIQDVLVTQAALRAAQSGDTVSPENMPLVIASLPSIIYQTPLEVRIEFETSSSLLCYISLSLSLILYISIVFSFSLFLSYLMGET